MNLVQDKVTIITGGTRGIGFAAAKIFIDNGAKVSIFGETQEEVDTALAQLKELYPEEEVLGFAPDLTFFAFPPSFPHQQRILQSV